MPALVDIGEHLPYWLWWTEDAAAIEWIRTFLAALVGALAGGLFTLLGQSRAERAQARRDVLARAAQIEEARRAALDSDMRSLHKSFADLMSEIDSQASPSWIVLGDHPKWREEWAKIWTKRRQASLRVRADLIPDANTRRRVLEIVEFLSFAEWHTAEAAWPGAPGRGLRWLATQLASEGAATLAAYLRREEHVSERVALLDDLRREDAELARWEQYQTEREEAAANEWYANATPEEIAEVEAMAAALFRGLREDDAKARRDTPSLPEGEGSEGPQR